MSRKPAVRQVEEAFAASAQRLQNGPPSIDAIETANLFAVGAVGLYTDDELIEHFKPTMLRSLVIGNRIKVLEAVMCRVPFRLRRQVLKSAVLHNRMSIVEMMTTSWNSEYQKPKWWPSIAREDHLSAAVLTDNQPMLEYLFSVERSDPWTYFMSCWDNPLKCNCSASYCVLMTAINENNINMTLYIQRETQRFDFYHLANICKLNRVRMMRALLDADLVKLNKSHYNLVVNWNHNIALMYPNCRVEIVNGQRIPVELEEC